MKLYKQKGILCLLDYDIFFIFVLKIMKESDNLKHNVASNYIIRIKIQNSVKGLLKENEHENRFDFNAA